MTAPQAAARSRLVKFQIIWAVVTTLFFVYTVLVWRGMVGSGDNWRPGRTAFLASALAMQGLAPLAGRRALWLQWVLLGASLAALWFTVRGR
jgi:hypothetical protein